MAQFREETRRVSAMPASRQNSPSFVSEPREEQRIRVNVARTLKKEYEKKKKRKKTKQKLTGQFADVP